MQREASKIIAEFEAEAIRRTSMFPHAAQLTELGLPLGIVTSNDAAVVRAILANAGMGSAFEVIVGRDEVRAIKPSPEGLLLCSGQLGVPTDQCVYVGDMSTDIVAARAASMPACGVLTGIDTTEDLRAAGATHVYEDLAAVLAALADSVRAGPPEP